MFFFNIKIKKIFQKQWYNFQESKLPLSQISWDSPWAISYLLTGLSRSGLSLHSCSPHSAEIVSICHLLTPEHTWFQFPSFKLLSLTSWVEGIPSLVKRNVFPILFSGWCLSNCHNHSTDSSSRPQNATSEQKGPHSRLLLSFASTVIIPPNGVSIQQTKKVPIMISFFGSPVLPSYNQFIRKLGLQSKRSVFRFHTRPVLLILQQLCNFFFSVI